MNVPATTILVLEEHAFQRSIAVMMLERSGEFNVLSAATIKQAHNLLQGGQRVDILLCEVRMDSLDSLLFLRQCGQKHNVRSLVLSSALNPDVQLAVEALVPQLGMALLGTLEKPLQQDQLSKLLALYPCKSVARDLGVSFRAQASELEVRKALLEGHIQPYFQPKFNLQTNEVVGAEVLARWLHPRRGVLPPAVFMPVLERCGLLNELLFSQLHQGLALQKTLKKQGRSVAFAYNLEVEQLANPTLVSRLAAVLKSHGMPASGLMFELTERGAFTANTVYQESLVGLRMLGCQLSIDDFGTGFSSLQRLCQAPFNELKLDAEFVRGAACDKRCQAIIQHMLALGCSLGMSVVLEGIETEMQRQALIELGATLGQGYLYAGPMSAADWLAWPLTAGYGKVDGL